MSGDLFSAIGSGIVILPSDHGAIGDPKINDWDRKNAIILAIVTFCSRFEVNEKKISSKSGLVGRPIGRNILHC